MCFTIAPIDALTGVVMGHSVAVGELGEGDWSYVMALDWGEA